MAAQSQPHNLSDCDIFDNAEDSEEGRRTLALSKRETRLTASCRAGRNGNVPPAQHRFRPGVSGNPGGHSRVGLLTKRLLAILEADDGKYADILVRATLHHACRGNGAAQRTVWDRVDGAPAGALQAEAEE